MEDVQAVVRDTHTQLFDLKRNLDAVAAVLSRWLETPLLERKTKPVGPKEFETVYKTARTARF